MSFDVFRLRDEVVGDYRGYVESFLNIYDPTVEEFVKNKLATGELWPSAVLQLNPAYEAGQSLKQLAAEGTISSDTARFFGEDLSLHKHQHTALNIAKRQEPYIVTTGTGSGKSLTYLLPIVDSIFRNEPDRHTARAILVYPMNALVNSQLQALEDFKNQNWPDAPLTFAKYTGETTKDEKNRILQDTPHILLTNYVMLEYMLIRPDERSLVHQATKDLRFLVMDELHVYRGRQGADVAMLLRRVRERSGNPKLQFVGTSATLASEGTREERLSKVAEVGARFFASPLTGENVVDETLKRVIAVPVPRDAAQLKAAIEAPPPTSGNITTHPLAAWVEETFGLTEEDGRLIRSEPRSFDDAVGELVEQTHLSKELCAERLKHTLEVGNRTPSGIGNDPVFAFRLHQFLASGSAVYTTFEAAEYRNLSMDAAYYAAGDGEDKVNVPLAFCRECGQDYYLVTLQESGDGSTMIPRQPLVGLDRDNSEGLRGYFAIDDGEIWCRDDWDDLQDEQPMFKRDRKGHEPRLLRVDAQGNVHHPDASEGVRGWFEQEPFLFCLRCRRTYDARGSDFRKLTTLSQTGRSTATTLMTASSIRGLRESEVEDDACKTLSFTDNRQDASLQAGHLNDFVQVSMLRGALVSVLKDVDQIGFYDLKPALFEALALTPDQFMQQPADQGPIYSQARDAMTDLLGYRALDDLSRTWRVTQPSLEECGLLEIRYDGLPERASNDSIWASSPVLASATSEKREEVLRALLDHLRSVRGIQEASLEYDKLRKLGQMAQQHLKEPWGIEEDEKLMGPGYALLPNHESPRARGVPRLALKLGVRSTLFRFLRNADTWGVEQNLSEQKTLSLIDTIIEALSGHQLSIVRHRNEPIGIQLNVATILWCRGTNQVPALDPVRTRARHLVKEGLRKRTPNAHFRSLYSEHSQGMRGVLAKEHTGQVHPDDRMNREKAFRAGTPLPILYCSPTMELGVDIRDLFVVHMRNVPPTPANYAQRSGRAGRGGRPALVLTFSSYANAHDHHFFRHKERMIAGAVTPPRLDLANKELVEAHLHSVWLSEVALFLGESVRDVLDLSDHTNCPLKPDKESAIAYSPKRRANILNMFQALIDSAGEEIRGATWYSDAWLRELVDEAPYAFNGAFERWRELYRIANEQLDAARKKIDNVALSKEERDEAEQLEKQAKRDRALLLNDGNKWEEADFYPYRYLAGEGFIPGYNFPRLPLRALVNAKQGTHSIDRARFLGISEFGPHNTVYHEGRKHTVVSCIVPAEGVDQQLIQGKMCKTCGYMHYGEGASAEYCVHCKMKLDAQTAEIVSRLFRQTTVRTRRKDRISSEEEERMRQGYDIAMYFRTTEKSSKKVIQWSNSSDEPLLTLSYYAQAQLWRVNHGWRRGGKRDGFAIDSTNGEWLSEQRRKQLEEEGSDAIRKSVKPFVENTRNLLLVQVHNAPSDESDRDSFEATLTYSIKRAIESLYEIEEHEIQAEVLGEGENRRIALWEAAEGGTGVWERLMEDAGSLPSLASEALAICHYNTDGTENLDDLASQTCARACYECLLSYSNQFSHRIINRHAVKDLLVDLATATRNEIGIERSYEEHYRHLLTKIDPKSSFEREFLNYLYDKKLTLPDLAQHLPSNGVRVSTDFFYKRHNAPGVCIFIDGPHHDSADAKAKDEKQRHALQNEGFGIVAIHHGKSIEDQVQARPDIFVRVQ